MTTKHLIAEMAGDDENEKNRTFVFNQEGNTFGNSLRCIIVKYPEVLFCGYTIPHPAEPGMHFRIQTNGPKAVDILKRGIEDLEQVCSHVKLVFEDRMEQFKQTPH